MILENIIVEDYLKEEYQIWCQRAYTKISCEPPFGNKYIIEMNYNFYRDISIFLMPHTFNDVNSEEAVQFAQKEFDKAKELHQMQYICWNFYRYSLIVNYIIGTFQRLIKNDIRGKA